MFIDNCVVGFNNDAVYVGGMYEYSRISKSVEEGEDIYQLRTTAVAKSQWGSGEEGVRAAAGVVGLPAAAPQPHQSHNFKVWGGFYSSLPASKLAWKDHFCGCLQSLEV